MPQSLAQLNASRDAIKRDFEQPLNALLQRLFPKPELFDGFSKTYQLLSEDVIPDGVLREELPTEAKRVQHLAADELARIRPMLTAYIDNEVSLDATNQTATADVTIRGTVIASDVPVTGLLFMHNRLAELYSLVEAVPVQNPAFDWTWSDSRGCYVTEPVETRHTKKLTRTITAIAPTEHQPGQFVAVNDDVRVGTWVNTRFTGAMPLEKKRALLARIREAQMAVKDSREDANRKTEAIRREPAEALLGFVFAGLADR